MKHVNNANNTIVTAENAEAAASDLMMAMAVVNEDEKDTAPAGMCNKMLY